MASEKKPKNYYVDYSKRNSKFGNRRDGGPGNSRYKQAPDITFGHRGFLITTVDEVKSYLEMRNIFEGYFELLYKPKDDNEPCEKKNTITEDEVESELTQLRATKPFKQLKTHCRNTVFINITKEFSYVDPLNIVNKFFEELEEKRQVRTGNTFKVLPILDTFRNTVSCAKESIKSVLENETSFQEEGPKKYFIEFQSRGNHKLENDDKQKMIEGVAEAITSTKPSWTVSREDADYIVILVSLKNVCCLSIVKDYFKRCKYNLIELCKDFVLLKNEMDQVKTDAHISS